MAFLRTLILALLALLPLPAIAQPMVDFAGYNWMVRTYPGGPGPNEWREANAWVDADGLHLAIRQEGDAWTAGEVVLLGPPLGFGTYEFEIVGDLAALDPNVVLGLFNYPGSPEIGPDGTNEIDIEFSIWGDTQNPNMLNWNVYPAKEGGEKGNHSLPIAPGLIATTHRFTWSAEAIAYESLAGHAASGALSPIGQWTYSPADPATNIPQQPLPIHMNLWLVEGRAPMRGQPVEIVIRDFRFVPS